MGRGSPSSNTSFKRSSSWDQSTPLLTIRHCRVCLSMLWCATTFFNCTFSLTDYSSTSDQCLTGLSGNQLTWMCTVVMMSAKTNTKSLHHRNMHWSPPYLHSAADIFPSLPPSPAELPPVASASAGSSPVCLAAQGSSLSVSSRGLQTHLSLLKAVLEIGALEGQLPSEVYGVWVMDMFWLYSKRVCTSLIKAHPDSTWSSYPVLCHSNGPLCCLHVWVNVFKYSIPHLSSR